jgi:hypothetical protein
MDEPDYVSGNYTTKFMEDFVMEKKVSTINRQSTQRYLKHPPMNQLAKRVCLVAAVKKQRVIMVVLHLNPPSSPRASP